MSKLSERAFKPRAFSEMFPCIKKNCAKKNKFSRNKAIELIDKNKKRTDFVMKFKKPPEEYFKKHRCKEPKIWFNILDELGITYSS